MNLADVFSKAAPWLAAAAAGPAGLAGMAIKTAAEALGSQAQTAEDLSAAIVGATPEQMAAFRQAENDFKLRMQEAGFKNVADLEAIAAGDRASARKAAVEGGTSRQLFWLSLVLLTACLGSEITVLFIGLPTAANDLVAGRVLGMLDAIALTVLTYNYGSTNNSFKKTELLAQAEPKR